MLNKNQKRDAMENKRRFPGRQQSSQQQAHAANYGATRTTYKKGIPYIDLCVFFISFILAHKY